MIGLISIGVSNRESYPISANDLHFIQIANEFCRVGVTESKYSSDPISLGRWLEVYPYISVGDEPISRSSIDHGRNQG